MLKRILIPAVALGAATFLCAACASTWAPNSITLSEQTQWRDQANAPLVRHVETITGFKRTKTTMSSILRYIVFGRSSADTMFGSPVAVAVGSDGRMAVADMGRACVHLYVPGEQRYRTITEAGKEMLRTPIGVAFDEELRLYVSDSTAGAVQVYDAAGEFLFSLRTAGDAAFRRPTGLAYSSASKLVYVIDTLAGRIYAFEPGGAYRFSIGGPGEQSGQFNFPTHVTAGPDGNLYVVDAMNFRIQILDASGRFLSSFGRHGNGSGDLAMPKGIAVDAAGVIYIVDTLFDTVQFFNLRERSSLPRFTTFSSSSLRLCLIFPLALEVITNDSQSLVGFWFLEMMISTWSPFLSLSFMEASLLLMRPPTHDTPSLECTSKAKSSIDDPAGIFFRSPLGVNTNISFW